MKFNLINIKTKRSRNGYAMSCTLVINNCNVLNFDDAGDGGMPYIEILNPELFTSLSSQIDELPEMFFEDFGCNIKIDISLFIDLLHNALANKQEFKLLAA